MSANAPKKFLFDTSFESARASAGEAKPTPKYFDADLETARAEGFAAGRAAGKDEAGQSIEQAAAQAANFIAERLGDLHKDFAAAQERRTAMAIELCAALVRKLFPKLSESHGLVEIEALVAAALERLRDEPRIVIRVADSLLDTMQATVDGIAQRAGFDGKIVLLAEPNLAPGDARVEWADGGAERDTERAWRDIDALIHNVVGAGADTNPGAADATQSPESSDATGGVSISA